MSIDLSEKRSHKLIVGKSDGGPLGLLLGYSLMGFIVCSSPLSDITLIISLTIAHQVYGVMASLGEMIAW
jgi:amino acid permease